MTTVVPVEVLGLQFSTNVRALSSNLLLRSEICSKRTHYLAHITVCYSEYCGNRRTIDTSNLGIHYQLVSKDVDMLSK